MRWLALAGVARHDQPAEGIGRDGTAGRQKAAVPDFHEAMGEDMLEASADTRDGVEGGGAAACPAGFAVGAGHGAVRARDATARGERHCEDIRGEGWQGGVGLGHGLAVDVPGDRPARWVEGLQPSGVGHLRSPHGAVARREGVHRDKEIGAGGEPRVPVCGATAPWDDGRERRGVLELPAPGRQAPGKTRQSRPDGTLVCGEPLEGVRRGGAQGLVGAALMGAETRT